MKTIKLIAACALLASAGATFGHEKSPPYMAHVRAGQRGDIVWQFNRPGTFDFACLIAGHYQAGMTGTITVVPRSR